jgi:hypothetical protein
MSRNPKENLDETKRLMGALGRMPPKPHADMKLGKAIRNEEKSLAKDRKRRRRGDAKKK